MIRYQTITPPPALQPYVRLYWVLESDDRNGMPYVHRSMADSCAELLFHYSGVFTELTDTGELPQQYSMLHAQSRHHRRFRTETAFGLFGIYLYPFALPLLTGFSSTAFSNHMPGLPELLGPEGRCLEEQMMLASDNGRRARIISSWLTQRLLVRPHKDERIFHAIREVVHAPQLQSLPELSAQYYLSSRQFERKFAEYSGFSPRLYQRIVRFHAAMHQYGRKDLSLTRIACECGYYDQSHFIHDFREFSGHHPRHYFSGNAEGTEWRDS